MPDITTAKLRLRSILSRRGHFAFALTGEAGIGKTHAATHLLLSVSCRFAKVHATARPGDLARALPKADRESALSRGILERVAKGATLPADVVLDAILARLVKLSPFVLYVEDLHEADDPTLEWWRVLARGVARASGVGLLVTTRVRPPEEFEAWHLPPLDEAASNALLEEAAGTHLPSDAKRWVYGHARGNPLFTLEYFRFLTHRGNLWSDGRTWRWREPGDVWPRTIEAIVEDVLSRAERDPGQERALAALTVLPPGTRGDVAARTADLPLDAFRSALEALRRAGILAETDFAHPLYREIARLRVPQEQVRTFARRALDVFRDTPGVVAPLVDLADVPPADAARLFEDAAQEARERGDAATAAAWLWAAATRADPERRSRLALAASHLVRSQDVKRASQYAAAAHDWTPTEETLVSYAPLLAKSGHAEEAATLLETRRSTSPAWWDAWVDVQAARGDLRSIVDAWSNGAVDREAASPTTKGCVALAMLNLGDLDGAHDLARGELDRADLTLEAQARLRHVLSGVAYFRGRYDESEEHQNVVVEAHVRRGALLDAARTLGARAMVRAATRRVPQAIEDTEQALVWLANAGDPHGYAVQQLRLGALLARSGEWTRAEAELLEARDALRRLDAATWLAECEGELAKLYLEWEPPNANVRALRHARAALASAKVSASAPALADATFVVSWAEARYGNASVALALADEAAALTPRVPRVHVGMGWLARGMALEALGDEVGAARAYDRSVEEFGTANIDVLSWRVQLERARLLGSRDLAERARAYFEASGMNGRALVASKYFPPVDSPAAPEDVEGKLELLVLGPLDVRQNGRSVPLRGRQSRALLARLLAARMDGRGGAARLELVDLLYPGQTEERGVGALQQLVHRLRAGLGANVVVNTHDGYALGSGVTSDAEGFRTSLDSRAWRGPALMDLDEGDVVQSELYAKLFDAARAELHDDPREAARAALLVLRASPYDFDVLRFALTALRRDRQHKKLASVYEESRAAWREVGETLPESWRDFLDGTPQVAGGNVDGARRVRAEKRRLFISDT